MNINNAFFAVIMLIILKYVFLYEINFEKKINFLNLNG